MRKKWKQVWSNSFLALHETNLSKSVSSYAIYALLRKQRKTKHNFNAIILLQMSISSLLAN